MTITEAEIIAGARAIAAALHVSPDTVIPFHPPLDGWPYAELRDGKVHYLVRERAHVDLIATFTDLDAFLYQLAEEETSSLARSWELEHRTGSVEDPDFDSRIAWVAKQLQLLNTVDPAWAERFRATVETRFSGLSLQDVDRHPVGP
ncbi:Imm63 family immunity protein [Streptomyces sp. NPDC059009]|uniref:Imm63 family immunity protein n=1 Tax=Streptomyces sp. NPDC059009 TaxID=3346694 RepID=UPI00368F520C